IRGLVATEATGRLTDAQLLERFTAGRSEAAFTELVRRHGPLVLGVCRRVLRHEQDAEDAFQATFLVLARKGGTVARRGAVSGWLYQVAFHAALRVRTRAATRQRCERQVELPPAPDPLAEVTGRELLAVLDEELQRLPEVQRTPLVLCCLEGKTCDEAARQAGLPTRTFKRRLQQARELLRDRLARRGLTLPAALLATGLCQAALPTTLTQAAVRTVVQAPPATA